MGLRICQHLHNYGFPFAKYVGQYMILNNANRQKYTQNAKRSMVLMAANVLGINFRAKLWSGFTAVSVLVVSLPFSTLLQHSIGFPLTICSLVFSIFNIRGDLSSCLLIGADDRLIRTTTANSISATTTKIKQMIM